MIKILPEIGINQNGLQDLMQVQLLLVLMVQI